MTDELHDGINRAGRGWRHKIILNHRPVISVTTIVEHRNGDPLTLTAESTTTLPTDGYLLDRYPPDPSLFSGAVRRRVSGNDGHWQWGRGNIAVTYQAGRVSSTTDVDPRFKRACGIVLENLWRDREPSLEPQGEYDVARQSFPTFAMPNAVRQLLTEEIGQNRTFGIA